MGPALGRMLADGRGATWVAGAVLLAFPTVGVLAKHGMSTLAIALCLLLVLAAVWQRRAPRLPPVFWAPAVALLAVLLVNQLLMPHCDGCWAAWLQPAAAVPVLLVLATGGLAAAALVMRPAVATALAAGVLVAAVVVAVELTVDAPIYRLLDGRAPDSFVSKSRYNRGLVALVMLAVVAAGALWREGRRVAGGSLLALVAGVTLLGDSLTAQLCALIAVLALGIGALSERLVRLVLIAAVAGQMLAMPWVAPITNDWFRARALQVDPTIGHRLELWDHGAALARERPWFGWGIDAFDRRPIAPERLEQARFMTKPESHPHNAGLQLWIEAGIVGIVLSIGFLLGIARGIGRLPAPLRPWATALLAVTLVPVMLSFGLWQVTYLAMAAVAAFAFTLLREAP
jgi:hypothetical protein